MDFIKKYWWLILLLPVVAYMVFVLMNKETGKPKPGSPEYARQAKEEKRLIKELELTPNDNGRDNKNDSININQN